MGGFWASESGNCSVVDFLIRRRECGLRIKEEKKEEKKALGRLHKTLALYERKEDEEKIIHSHIRDTKEKENIVIKKEKEVLVVVRAIITLHTHTSTVCMNAYEKKGTGKDADKNMNMRIGRRRIKGDYPTTKEERSLAVFLFPFINSFFPSLFSPAFMTEKSRLDFHARQERQNWVQRRIKIGSASKNFRSKIRNLVGIDCM